METKDLKKENEELKFKHRELSKEYMILHFDYLTSVKENKKLKEEILRLKSIIALQKVSQNGNTQAV